MQNSMHNMQNNTSMQNNSAGFRFCILGSGAARPGSLVTGTAAWPARAAGSHRGCPTTGRAAGQPQWGPGSPGLGREPADQLELSARGQPDSLAASGSQVL